MLWHDHMHNILSHNLTKMGNRNMAAFAYHIQFFNDQHRPDYEEIQRDLVRLECLHVRQVYRK